METEPQLDRSDYYQEKIDSTREEIRGIRGSDLSKEEQTEAAREKAAELRMEVMLDQARLTKVLLNTLEDNPDITLDQFIEMAKSTGAVYNPEATRKFQTSLIECRDRVSQAIESAKFAADWNAPDDYLLDHPGEDINSPSDPEDLERRKTEILTSRILRSFFQENPQGKITLGLSRPLAIEVDFENLEDFQKIDPRQNVGGFYDHEYSQPASGRKAFPLIAVLARGSATAETRLHERIHSINASVKAALPPGVEPQQKWSKRFSKKIVWSNLDDDYANKFGQATSRKTMDEMEISDLALNRQDRYFEQSKEFQNLLDYALGHAKDEIIAYGISGRASETFYILDDQEGLYNYFKTMQIPSVVQDSLWSAYEPIIRQATSIVQKIDLSYSGFGMDERFELVLSALATVPIEKWQTVCEQNLFTRELYNLQLIDGCVRDILSRANRASDSSVSSELYDQYYQMRSDIISLFVGRGEKPLFDVMEEAAKMLGFGSMQELQAKRLEKAK